jgi:hypothetical protein
LLNNAKINSVTNTKLYEPNVELMNKLKLIIPTIKDNDKTKPLVIQKKIIIYLVNANTSIKKRKIMTLDDLEIIEEIRKIFRKIFTSTISGIHGIVKYILISDNTTSNTIDNKVINNIKSIVKSSSYVI